MFLYATYHAVAENIEVLDVEFISATITSVTLRSRRNTLPLARSLLRMDSAELLWNIKAHHFISRVIRTSDEANLTNHVRKRAELARQEFYAVPLLKRLVQDRERPWTHK